MNQDGYMDFKEFCILVMTMAASSEELMANAKGKCKK